MVVKQTKPFFQIWKQHAAEFKIQVYALYLAYQDPRVPWYARIFAACVVGYAFSSIDLIPDFIPILGYLDDLILVPLGVWLALKMIPAEVIEECRQKAVEGKPVNKIAAGVIILIWVLLGILAIYWIIGFLDHKLTLKGI